MQRYKYNTCCVESTAELINNMVDNSQSVKRSTFFRHVAVKDVHSIGRLTGIYGTGGGISSIKKDWHVSYHKGFYNGVKCYYLVHSLIEYIFTLTGE